MALFYIGGKNVSCLIENSLTSLLAIINLALYTAQQKCIKIHSHVIQSCKMRNQAKKNALSDI